MFSLAAVAQERTIVKGSCIDEHGKPIAGATVEFSNLENGGKISFNTDSQGKYYSNTVSPGTYKVTLTSADGKASASLNVTIKAGAENVTDFTAVPVAQNKETEKVKKDNEKIRGLNALLQQAAQQKKDQQYDAAVATMEQAAAQDQTRDIIYRSLADAYILDKKFPEAEAAYNKAIALAPADSKSLGSDHA